MLIGFSGGGDSTALLQAACEAASKTGKACLAGVIDHGLRDGSAADAATAAAVARSLGAEPVIVTLSGLAGGQANARLARHVALCAIARQAGAGAILLGHTEDDLAETVLMRLAGGAGPRGLAAMGGVDWSPLWPQGRGQRAGRPFSRLPREA